ncbi:hypothetical protein LEP1GSC018_2309 [Leptospira kirschneri str. 2008720114]|nr:hypothetical protein LEP1GSC018_2309 [Leptospira kirschneri str. 2008720114]EMK12630.1 hypothetical protein LEP1GSC042_0611 [Leptospira kirschneri serovar Bim str. PUO 1247]
MITRFFWFSKTCLLKNQKNLNPKYNLNVLNFKFCFIKIRNKNIIYYKVTLFLKKSKIK